MALVRVSATGPSVAANSGTLRCGQRRRGRPRELHRHEVVGHERETDVQPVYRDTCQLREILGMWR